jgi:hypothetical protein
MIFTGLAVGEACNVRKFGAIDDIELPCKDTQHAWPNDTLTNIH